MTTPAGDSQFTQLIVNFNKDDFEGDEFTSKVLNGSSMPASLQKLSSGVGLVESALKEQIENHYTDLLDQAQHVKELELVLSQTMNGVNHLEDALERVREDIGRPFRGIAMQTDHYARVIATCDLLRKVLRFLQHSRNLETHLASDDLAQAASELSEALAVHQEADLEGIEVVECFTKELSERRALVIQKSVTLLEEGLETQNQTSVSTAIRTFDNLNMLSEYISSTLQKTLKLIEARIDSIIELQRAAKVDESMRPELWKRTELLIESLYSCCVRLLTLQSVMNRTPDFKTFGSLLKKYSEASQTSFLLDRWASVVKLLKERLFNQIRLSGILDLNYVLDFPRLLRLFRGLFTRLQPHVDLASKLPQLGAESQQLLFDLLFTLSKRYLTSVSTRITDHINALFPPGSRSSPIIENATSLNKLLLHEVAIVNSDQELLLNVLKTIASCLKLFNVRVIENIQPSGPIKEQLAPAQLTNINLYNLLIQLNTTILELAPPEQISAHEIVSKLSADIQTVCEQTYPPLFGAALNALEQLLLKMHSEDWRAESLNKTNEPTSAYMSIFQKRVLHFQSIFLSRLTPSSLLKSWCARAVDQLLAYFIRSACLIRNPSPSGKLQLAADMAQISPIFPPKLVPQYKYLRSLRPLIFYEVGELRERPEIWNLPPSIVLLQLFSRGPKKLESPHSVKNLSMDSYIHWLTQHSEAESWQLFSDSLTQYANHVNKSGLTEYHSIYPVIMDLGPKMLTAWMTKHEH